MIEKWRIKTSLLARFARISDHRLIAAMAQGTAQRLCAIANAENPHCAITGTQMQDDRLNAWIQARRFHIALTGRIRCHDLMNRHVVAPIR